MPSGLSEVYTKYEHGGVDEGHMSLRDEELYANSQVKRETSGVYLPSSV